MDLVEDSSLPLFKQVENLIRGEIERGVYAPGDSVPSERELADHYQISRVTVRHAIQNLVERGFLTKVQGKGTFVSPVHLERQITQSAENFTFVEMCEAEGKNPSTRFISVSEVKGTASERNFLRTKDTSLICVQRVRLADGVPVMLENSLFPKTGFEFLLDKAESSPTIFGLVENEAGRKVGGHARRTLRSARADQPTSELLHIPVGEPLFLETVNFLDTDDEPLMIGEDFFVGSLMEFDF